MPNNQSFTNEQEVEEEAIDLIVSLGYTDLRSAEYNRPNIQVDSERDNDHQKIVLEPRLMAAFKQINPGLPNFVYTEALRQFKSIPDGPDLMANNHHFHKLLIEGASVT
ncbi:type I restriction endonuclease, partial [Loigolactobacillus coryniformis]